MRLRTARGDTRPWRFEVTQDGAPQSLVGATVRFSVRERMEDAAPLITRTVGSGITVEDAAAGIVEVRLAEADTATFVEPRTLYWDLEVVDSEGNRATVADGLLYVRPDVSR